MAPRRENDESPQRIPVLTSAVEMTGSERAMILGLQVFALAPQIVSWVYLFRENCQSSAWQNSLILGLFAFLVIETVILYLLRGFGRISIPYATLRYLAGASIAAVVPMAWYLIKKAG